MPHALSLSLASLATLACRMEGYFGAWVPGYLGTSPNTDAHTEVGVADKPCLGLAPPYRAAGRYATTAPTSQHHHHHHTTTQPHQGELSPNPHPIPTHTK